ncbi:hypothetical protein FRX31_027640 [Thalictrum thalictroides]|uniref:Uncharacterized protein n=1 Tax=Thalictrum thalictroides TaxID=46969 RepID=A0A7J6VCD8_THATH|nr:hypothetical protein FRX31_027640 [Thalictrum thalictroides]
MEKKAVNKKKKKGENPNDDMRSHHLMGTLSSSAPPTEKINSTHQSIPSSSRNIISADSMNKSLSNLVIKGSKLELDLAAVLGWKEKAIRGRRALTKEEACSKEI